MTLTTDKEPFALSRPGDVIRFGPVTGNGAFQFSRVFRIDTSRIDRFIWRIWKSGLNAPYEATTTTDSFHFGIQTSTSPTTGFIDKQDTTQATAATTGDSFYERTTSTFTSDRQYGRLRWSFADKTLVGNVDFVERTVPTGTAGATGHLSDLDESYTYTAQGTFAYQGIHFQKPVWPKPRRGYPVILVASHSTTTPGQQGTYDIKVTVPAGSVNGAAYTSMGPIGLSQGFAYMHIGLNGSNSRANDGTTALSDNGLIRNPSALAYQAVANHSCIKEVGQAIQYLRANAGTLEIDPEHIYVYGYKSAALPVLASAYWPNLRDPESSEALKQFSSAPNGIIVEEPDGYHGAYSAVMTNAYVSLFPGASGIAPATNAFDGAAELVRCSITEIMQATDGEWGGHRIPVAIISENNADGTGSNSFATTDVGVGSYVGHLGAVRPTLSNTLGSLNTSWNALMLRKIRSQISEQFGGGEGPTRTFQTGRTAAHTGEALTYVDETANDRTEAQRSALSWLMSQIGREFPTAAQVDGVLDKAHAYIEVEADKS